MSNRIGFDPLAGSINSRTNVPSSPFPHSIFPSLYFATERKRKAEERYRLVDFNPGAHLLTIMGAIVSLARAGFPAGNRAKLNHQTRRVPINF